MILKTAILPVCADLAMTSDDIEEQARLNGYDVLDKKLLPPEAFITVDGRRFWSQDVLDLWRIDYVEAT